MGEDGLGEEGLGESELGAALRALAREMNEAAGRGLPELSPPPSFAVRGGGAAARFVITTDNGGGAETSHPIERVIEVRWGGAAVSLREPSGELELEGVTGAEALARLRAICVAALPDETLG